MHGGIVADRRDGAEPAEVHRLALLRAVPAARIERADVDRAGPTQKSLAEALGDLIGHLGAQLRLRLQLLGRRHVGHRVLMMQPALLDLEGGGEIEDRLTALGGDDAPVGEALAVEIAHHPIENGILLVAGTHEIGV